MKITINDEIRKILETAENPTDRYLKLCDVFYHEPRMNEDTGHVIIFARPTPKIPGFRDTEVVIGVRATSFCPYVAWLAFDKTSYAYGDYCQTLDEAIECAQAKYDREIRYGR